MFTLSDGEPRAWRLSRRPQAGRRCQSRRLSLEALEDRNLLQASPTNPAAAAASVLVGSASPGSTATSANQTVVANNGTLAASTAAPAGNGTVATLGQAAFSLTPAALNNLTPTGSAVPLVPNQGTEGSTTLFSVTTVNGTLPGGQPSPGVPYGFAGRIVFANTGTPERTGQGVGAFSPAAGVVPAGLYLGGGGDLAGGTSQPAQPNPQSMPILPGRGLLLSDAEQEGGPATDVLPATEVADLALEGYTGSLNGVGGSWVDLDLWQVPAAG